MRRVFKCSECHREFDHPSELNSHEITGKQYCSHCFSKLDKSQDIENSFFNTLNEIKEVDYKTTNIDSIDVDKIKEKSKFPNKSNFYYKVNVSYFLRYTKKVSDVFDYIEELERPLIKKYEFKKPFYASITLYEDVGDFIWLMAITKEGEYQNIKVAREKMNWMCDKVIKNNNPNITNISSEYLFQKYRLKRAIVRKWIQNNYNQNRNELIEKILFKPDEIINEMKKADYIKIF